MTDARLATTRQTIETGLPQARSIAEREPRSRRRPHSRNVYFHVNPVTVCDPVLPNSFGLTWKGASRSPRIEGRLNSFLLAVSDKLRTGS